MNITCCPLSANDECEAASFYQVRRPKAAKEHVCGECRERISTGDRYEYVTGVWDGLFDSYKTCLSCVEIRMHFQCNGWLFGQLWEDLQDNFFPTMKAGGPCMQGLSPEAKSRLFERCLAWRLK